MRDDRPPQTPVQPVEDVCGLVWDMDVVLSRVELRTCLGVGFDQRTLEPWVRVTQGLDWEVVIGCDDVTGEDDGA